MVPEVERPIDDERHPMRVPVTTVHLTEVAVSKTGPVVHDQVTIPKQLIEMGLVGLVKRPELQQSVVKGVDVLRRAEIVPFGKDKSELVPNGFAEVDRQHGIDGYIASFRTFAEWLDQLRVHI